MCPPWGARARLSACRGAPRRTAGDSAGAAEPRARVLHGTTLRCRRRRSTHLAGSRVRVQDGAPAVGPRRLDVSRHVPGVREAARAVESELGAHVPHRAVEGLALEGALRLQGDGSADPAHPRHDGAHARLPHPQPTRADVAGHRTRCGMAARRPRYPRLLAPAAPPEGDSPAAALRTRRHPGRASGQGIRHRNHEQARLADAHERLDRRGKPDVRDPAPRGGLSMSIPNLPRAAAVTAAAFLALSSATAVSPAARASSGERPAAPTISPEDADREAALVTAEDRRLTEIRTVASLSRWRRKNWKTPYRLSSGSGYTLVLTPSSAPYTLSDLQRLAPQTLLRMSDGSYLLTEDIVVAARATLHLAAPGGLTLRLASGSDGFAALVSMGGRVELAGGPDAPVTITSWDVDRGAEDTRTVDGRAYVRSIGGQFEAEHVRLSHLGFWSGRTGGLSLTGTDRPNTGAIESTGSPAGKGTAPSLLNGVGLQPAGRLPAGQKLTLKYAVPATDYVSTRIADTTIDGNAFGLLVLQRQLFALDRRVVLISR